MQFPQKNDTVEKVRNISTSDIDVLTQFHVNKNRQYTQLQPGDLHSNYTEVILGDVQLFRECLTTGARIEAAPASNFVPFAALLPDSGDTHYCGRSTADNSLLQATGGEWDVSFTGRLDYICTAFDRETLTLNIENLTGHEIPKNWFTSKACLTNPLDLNCYALGVASILQTVNSHPELLHNSSVERMLSAEVLTLALNALRSTAQYSEKLNLQSNRIKGVCQVIDYLQVHAAQLPTISDLCKIAGMSERSLEYGFREYLEATPIQYLRLVRLHGVRRDLLASVSCKIKIVDVALKWGFLELGRFSGEYRQLFGERPSQTRRAMN